MSEQSPVYEERRGWTTRNVVTLVIMCLLDVALAVLFGISGGWIGMFFVAFLLAGLVAVVDGGVRKPVALRMDEHGIALTKSTARKPTVLVPWSELHAVWLVRHTRRVDTIGVVTESGPEEPRRYFPMIDWHVDVDRLTETVACYAPKATIRKMI
ncbi:MAG TPA: hypothetical protein VG247_29960 [Pseudonocardiaceae bacterium]|nr:hypothetical protein [Pseudonocardiaceae bacterium]